MLLYSPTLCSPVYTLAVPFCLCLVALVSVCRLVNYLLCRSIPFVSMVPKVSLGVLLLFVFLLSVGL